MLRPLDIHPNAADDIRDIKAGDPSSAAKIMTLIQELKNDEELQEKLLEHHTTAQNDTIDIMQVVSQRENNLGRIKFIDLPHPVAKYRIFYAFNPISQYNNRQSFSIMAVTIRSDDTYEPSNEIIQRINKAIREGL